MSRIYPAFHIVVASVALVKVGAGQSLSWSTIGMSLSGYALFFTDAWIGGAHLWFISVILVCYILFIPLAKVAETRPTLLALGLVVSLGALVIMGGPTVYEDITRDAWMRLAYHFWVFSAAVLIAQKYEELISFDSWLDALALGALFALYQYASKVLPHTGLKVFAAIAVAWFAMATLSLVFRKLSFAWHRFEKISQLSYEIYLIHYPVIVGLAWLAEGQWWAYPATFALSIALALVLRPMSNRYLGAMQKLRFKQVSRDVPIR